MNLYVRCVDFATLCDFLLDLRTVPTVWYFSFCFHFIKTTIDYAEVCVNNVKFSVTKEIPLINIHCVN